MENKNNINVEFGTKEFYKNAFNYRIKILVVSVALFIAIIVGINAWVSSEDAAIERRYQEAVRQEMTND